MLKEIRKYALENNIPIIQDEGLNFLLKYIQKHQVKNILEVGSAIGYSAIMMAKSDPNLNILTIEIDTKRYQIAQKNINKFNLSNRINIINTDANTYTTNQKFDLIFLDGAKAQYKKSLNHFYENLSEQGIVIVDNLGFHGLVFQEELNVKRRTRQLVEKIKQFRQYILNDPRFNATIFDDIGDGMGLLINKKGCKDE